MLDNAIEVTELCRNCLMCRHVCPVGNLTRDETLTPHGWAQLVALEKRGLSDWNAETVNALYKCADCGNCESHCVYSNPLPDGIVAARVGLVEQGLAPARVYELGEILKEWENPHVPQLPEAAAGVGEAALFVGDEVHHLRPQALAAALALLAAVGVKPVLIGRGRNSGYLASSLGLLSIGQELALRNLSELKATGARRLYVLSPGDYYTITRVYRERLNLRDPEGVEVVEVTPFLAREFAEGRLRLNRVDDGVRYAYVDPTHSVRVAGRYGAPRELLSAVLPEPALELFWRDQRAQPCGDLALEFTQPEIAAGLTQARLADAAQAGAQGVITEGVGTLVHLERQAAAFGMQARGLFELLAERRAR